DQKTTSQANLDGLKNLNDAQKAAAKEAIEAATTPAGVEKALATAQKLDGKMGELDQAAQEADEVKSSLDYTNADKTAQQAYDEALTNAQAILDKAQGGNASAAEVQVAKDALELAKSKLNGDEKLT
ncbi:FIVAR domain-containing protein, partial [Ligilactobacillus sp. MP3]|uniref:FIVAR domain-containing protein n=1 Tax=Ligilactobacillus sp. MP3 TaxID=2965103 RepID=UPI00210868EC